MKKRYLLFLLIALAIIIILLIVVCLNTRNKKEVFQKTDTVESLKTSEVSRKPPSPEIIEMSDLAVLDSLPEISKSPDIYTDDENIALKFAVIYEFNYKEATLYTLFKDKTLKAEFGVYNTDKCIIEQDKSFTIIDLKLLMSLDKFFVNTLDSIQNTLSDEQYEDLVTISSNVFAKEKEDGIMAHGLDTNLLKIENETILFYGENGKTLAKLFDEYSGADSFERNIQKGY